MHVRALLEACNYTLYLCCPYMMHNRSAKHIPTIRKMDAWQFIWGHCCLQGAACTCELQGNAKGCPVLLHVYDLKFNSRSIELFLGCEAVETQYTG